MADTKFAKINVTCIKLSYITIERAKLGWLEDAFSAFAGCRYRATLPTGLY